MSDAISELRKCRPLPHRLASDSRQPPDLGNSPILDGSIQFADGLDGITSLQQASSLLLMPELKALTKEEKVQGRNKSELVKALCDRVTSQRSITFGGLHTSEISANTSDSPRGDRNKYLMNKVLKYTGDCIRVSDLTFRLFERVHLIFYRSTEWTEKSLSTIILAKISRRNFPRYTVLRSQRIFKDRENVLEFESAMRIQHEVDNLLEFHKETPNQRFEKLRDISEAIYPRWKTLLAEEKMESPGTDVAEGKAYLLRFSPIWVYTRIIHKGLQAHARFKNHKREHSILCELLDQKWFHPARRGAWYQRKALLEEHYAWELYPCEERSIEEQKKFWKRSALHTAESGLQDPQTHIIYHYDLQKRIVKLEKALRVVKRVQHDFGHVMLAKPIERTVKGIQLKSPPLAEESLSSQRKGKPTGGKASTQKEEFSAHW
ncbi:hypothetical protein KEM56_002824 [Ascosphaera pollenicola]|nr:hypothetical protein KEM56_002824 [Ascosphaera pollenicola]